MRSIIVHFFLVICLASKCWACYSVQDNTEISGPCDEKIQTIDVSANFYDSIPGIDETMRIINVAKTTPATMNVPANVYDSIPGIDETMEVINVAKTSPIAVDPSYENIRPIEEFKGGYNLNAAQILPADVDSSYEIIEPIEMIQGNFNPNAAQTWPAAVISNYEVNEPIEKIQGEYNLNGELQKPVVVNNLSQQFRSSRRSFGKIKEKMEEGLKEIELKFSRTGFGTIGDTVGSTRKIANPPLQLKPISGALKSSFNEFIEQIRTGKGKAMPNDPSVGKATPILQPLRLFEKIKPAKSPVDEPQVGKAAPNIIQPTRPMQHVRNPVSQPKKMLGDVQAGPIVQPTGLFEDDEKPLPKHVPHNVTQEQLHDVKDIRAEINYAVNHNKYAHSKEEIQKIYQAEHHVHHHHHDHHHNHHHNGKNDSLMSPQNTETNSDKSVSSIVGSQRSDFSYIPDENRADALPAPLPMPMSLSTMNATLSDIDRQNEELVDEMMAKKLAADAPKEIIANVIESHEADGAEAEESFVSSDLRESLHIKSLTEDTQFKLGHNVIEWKTIQRNARDKHALVGLTATGVILLVEKNGSYVVQEEMPLISSPSCMTTFTRWNRTQQVIEGIVIVATRTQLVFFRINEALDEMRLYWMVSMNEHIVSAIEYVTVNDAHLIVLVSANEDRPSANLYRFALDHREFYLRESLTLAVPASTVASMSTGSEHFLAFPQRKSAVVYKYSQDRFKYFAEIDAENIETLETFEMGGNTYLALGGTRPRILRYHRGEFHDQTILAPSWGIVEYFLPIPARTYRDDLIVLIQHRIDFSTHNISVLEALIWNGEAFDPALSSIDCIINGKISENGLGCMLDTDRQLGIQGATVFQRNNFITILAPRHEAPSGLFDLEFELMPSEYQYDEMMINLFSEILVMLEARNQQVTDAQKTYFDFEMSRDEEIVIVDRTFNTIVTNFVEWDAEIAPTTKIFYGNESTDTKTITNFIFTVNEKQASMEPEPPRAKRDEIKRNVVEWQSLDVLNLFVESINDVSADEFVFVQNKTLELNGTLVLQQPLDFDEVQWREGAPQQTIAAIPDQTSSKLRADANEKPQDDVIERLDIPGDFSFEEINGIPWQDLISEIVLKNQPQDLSELIVDGELIAEGELNVQNLNNLSFPTGFLWNDGSHENIITGRKEFTNVLVTDVIDCTGTINGIDPMAIVTLSDDQFIPGTTTFRHLEVTEVLEVSPKGQIIGRHLKDFMANPTLLDTNFVTANCIAKSIEVQGSVFIQNTLNDQHVDNVLSDVIYKHEPEPKCSSFKTFSSMSATNIELTSNLVNGIQLDDFVTTDSDQTFNVDKMHGNVFFSRLNLGGLFNYINATELDENTIKLFGEQYTEAELIFEGPYDGFAVDANALDILTTINKLSVDDFIGVDENFKLNDDITLNTFVANECIVGGKVNGGLDDGKINGWNVQALEKSYLSKNREQQIFESFHVRTAMLRGTFDANHVNNYDFQEALNILKSRESNEALLNQTHVNVARAVINGGIQFDQVNGYDFNAIQANAIWLNRANNVAVSLTFSGQMNILGNLTTVELNNANFVAFANDLVLKSNEKPYIMGTTIFRQNLRVTNDINSTHVNGYGVDRMLLKGYNLPIPNPINIYGDVFISDLVVNGTLGGMNGYNIWGNYHFDEASQSHVVNKDVRFGDGVHIDYLQLNGSINAESNANYHLATIVQKRRLNKIDGVKTFADAVHFENDIQILDYNGIAVDSFLNNVILIDQSEPIDVHSIVVFNEEVKFTRLNVNGALKVDTIADCSMTEWYTNAIRTDLPYQFARSVTFGAGTIEVGNIDSTYLNNRLAQHIVTLKTEQRFDKKVNLINVVASAPFNVSGSIDGIDLVAERANTLMVYGEQYVTLSTDFQSVRVLHQLETVDTVNDKNLKAAISLGQDIYLYGPLSFKAITVANLYTSDLISNIDFTQWIGNSFRSWAPQPQIVTGRWTVKNAIIDSISSSTGLNGVDAATYATKIDLANQNLYQNYKETCNRVQSLVNESQKNVVFLSHFEIGFKLPHATRIDSIYLFEVDRQNYLLTNAGCWTTLYYWNHQTDRYEPLSNAYTGIVNEWIHLVDLRNAVHFVSNGEQTNAKTGCSVSGANIWKYQSETQTIVAVATIGSAGVFNSLQVKPNSRTHFYALRIRDNCMIEYNLNGAPVTEWIVDQVQGREAAWNFIPASANLGLAISNGNSLKLLANDRIKLSSPSTQSKSEQQQREIEQMIANLRKELAEYNADKEVIFSDGVLNAEYDPKELEQNRERVRKMDDSIVPLANELIEALENGLHATAMASTMNPSEPEVGSGFGLDIGGRLKELIVSELGFVSNFVTGERSDSDESDESSGEEGILSNLLGNSQQINLNSDMNDRKQNALNDEANVGDKFGDLMDDLTPTADIIFDKLIDKIRLKKLKMPARPENAHDYADVGSAKNTSIRPDDAKVLGDKFGDLFEKLTPVADDVFDKIVTFIRMKKANELDANGNYNVGNVQDSSDLSSDHEFVGELFSYLQGKIQLELIRDRDLIDPKVGDKFGDAMEDLTPVADVLFDKLIDKIKAKKHKLPIYVDEYARIAKINVNVPKHSVSNNNRKQNTSNDEANVGDKFGDFMDNLTPTADVIFDKLIDKIRLKKLKLQERPKNTYNYADVGSAKNILLRPDDATVLGDKFGDLFEKLSPVADDVFDKLINFIQKKKAKAHDANSNYDVESSTDQAFVGDTVSYMQDKIRQELMRDPNVGDKFGDAIEDLTPFADVIFDKLIDKIQAKKRRRPISIKELTQVTHINATMSDIVQIIQNQRSMHYDPFDQHGSYFLHGAHEGRSVEEIGQTIQEAVEDLRDDEKQISLMGPLLGSSHHVHSNPMIGDSENLHKYSHTFQKYVEIAKKVYKEGKLVYEEIKGLKDDNTDNSEDYAAPESHQNGIDSPSDTHRPLHHEPNVPNTPHSHHESNANSEFHHANQQDVDIRPQQNDFDIPSEPHRPHQHDPNAPEHNFGDHSLIDHDSIQPHHNDFDIPSEPHRPHQHDPNAPEHNFGDHNPVDHDSIQPHHNDFDIPAESHRPHQPAFVFPDESNIPHSPFNDHQPNHHIDNIQPLPHQQTAFDASSESHQPFNHAFHHPQESITPESHRPNLHDFDIPPDDIRFRKQHKNFTNTNEASIRAKQYNDRYNSSVRGSAKTTENLQLTHQDDDDPFMVLSHTDANGSENAFDLNADPIVGDVWVYAFRKCASFVNQVYKNGKRIVGKMKNETRRSKGMVGSAQEIRENQPNAQTGDNSLFSINLLDDMRLHNGSDLHTMAPDARNFHDDNENLREQLKSIYVKYSDTNVGDVHETKFRKDLHKVFAKMEKIVAKYDKKAKKSNRRRHKSRRRNKNKKPSTKQLDAMSVSLPNPYVSPSLSNNEIVAVTVGPERKPLIIVLSQRENVIKGDHDSIQIYEDIVDGKLYQTISCYKPGYLTTFQIESESILAFIEDSLDVRTFIYRGVQGFVEFTSFKLPLAATAMVHNRIVNASPIACPQNYLAITVNGELWFIKAVTVGHCKIADKLKC